MNGTIIPRSCLLQPYLLAYKMMNKKTNGETNGEKESTEAFIHKLPNDGRYVASYYDPIEGLSVPRSDLTCTDDRRLHIDPQDDDNGVHDRAMVPSLAASRSVAFRV